MPSMHPETAGLSARDRKMMEFKTPEKAPVFHAGQIVRVRRSDGRVDDGWEVVTPLNEKGRVVVVKQIDEERVRKGIMEANLVRLNPDKGADEEEIAGELQQRVFEVGEEVVVERGESGSGKLEPGWRVLFPLERGMVVVHREVQGGSLTKRVSPEELAKWNPRKLS